MSLCGVKSCVPYAIKIQNYVRQTEVEEEHTLPEMITLVIMIVSYASNEDVNITWEGGEKGSIAYYLFLLLSPSLQYLHSRKWKCLV